MTEILERNLTTQEQIDNAHDANFKETLERLGKIPDPVVLEFKDGKGRSTVIKEQIIYPYYKKLGLDDSAKTDYLLVKKIINKLVAYNIMESADDAPHNGETKEVKRKIIIEAVQEYLQEKKSQSRNGHESAQEAIPQTISYKIKSGDTLISITKNEILKYYPQLNENDKKKLTNPNTSQVIALLRTYNGGSDNLQAGKTLTIDMGPITQAIQDYLNNKNGGNNGHENTPQQQTQPQTQPQQPHSQLNPETQNQQNTEAVNENIPEMVTITIENNLDYTVRKQIYKYYPNLNTKQKSALLPDIMEDIKEQSKTQKYEIKDISKVQAGKTVDVNMPRITAIIEKYIKDHEAKIEIINGQEYIVLEKYEDLERDHPLLEKIKNDNKVGGAVALMKPRMKKALEKGEKVIIPNYIENKDSEKIELDKIIEPSENEKIDNVLEKQTFILDPGHGFDDPGALGLVKCNELQKTNAVIYESGMVMDVTYRVAKLLRAHGATVKFTHRIPTRGISNNRDLPPCLPGQNGYQDVWNGSTERWGLDAENSKAKRCEESGKYNGMFISFHADATSRTSGKPSTTELLPDEKRVTTKYRNDKNVKPGTPEKERQNKSKEFADYLMTNENGVPYQEGYTQKSDPQDLYVLGRENSNPAVLMELFNLNNNEQGNQYRDPNIRQQKAKEIVDATINYYQNK